MTLLHHNIIIRMVMAFADEITPPMTLRQNDDTRKEDFLYFLTESLVLGTRDYIKIPADKFVMGLPTNNNAAKLVMSLIKRRI